MNVRPLGSTGLPVTPIGLGLAALGRPAYLTLGREVDLGVDRSVPAMERRCHEMLDSALAAGIGYIDTARSYGLAETFLASWLNARELPSGALTIGSKWGYTYTGAWRLDAPTHEEKDLSLATLNRQLAESRALLGSRLRLYQMHSATLESGALDDRAVLARLAALQSEGLFVGLTVSGPRQGEVIRRALSVDVNGSNPFQSVQATWNLLEPSAGPALAEARARGWGVIVKEALANGRLTDEHAGDSLRPLGRQAQALGIGLDTLSIAVVLSQPWVDVVLSGAVTTEQLRSHVSALTISTDAIEWPQIAESPEAYWRQRSTFGWT